MKRPLVTLCVPTIGRVQYLRQVLAAVRAQTYPSLEVLILDNESGPDARAVIDEFVAANPGARSLRVENRVPSFANFNRGIAAATGEYVAFFHDDDVYHATFVERLVGLLESNPDAGFAGGNFDLIDGAGRQTRRQVSFSAPEVWPGDRYIEEVFRTGRNPMPTPGMMFRRELVQRFNFDETLPVNWGDFTIFMRMAEVARVAVTDEVLFAWRVHGQNGSNIIGSISIPLRTQVLGNYLAEFRARHPEKVGLAAQLKAHLARTHEVGLLWSWLTAPDESEARACREALRGARGSIRAASGLLSLLENVGIPPQRLHALLPTFRRIGQALGG